MPNKTEEYLALAQRTANGLTRYWESWTDYLTTASRLYKYPFADQLIIYGLQRDTCIAGMRWSDSPSSFPSTGSSHSPCAGQGQDILRFCLA